MGGTVLTHPSQEAYPVSQKKSRLPSPWPLHPALPRGILRHLRSLGGLENRKPHQRDIQEACLSHLLCLHCCEGALTVGEGRREIEAFAFQLSMEPLNAQASPTKFCLERFEQNR